MNVSPYLIATILLTASSQLLQKFVALRSARSGRATHAYFRDNYFWLALLLLACAMATWLCALASLEISKAYALLSINYVLVPLTAVLIFGERMSRRNWLGTCVLCLGVVLIGHS